MLKPYELYRQLPDAERRLMTLTIFDQLKVDTKKIVDHQLRPPFAELVEVQQRRETPAKARKSYQRLAGRLDATWQATLDQVGQEIKQGTLVTEDALNFDAVSLDNLLELALLEGLSSYKAVLVVLGCHYTNTPILVKDQATAVVDGDAIHLAGSNAVLRTGDGDR